MVEVDNIFIVVTSVVYSSLLKLLVVLKSVLYKKSEVVLALQLGASVVNFIFTLLLLISFFDVGMVVVFAEEVVPKTLLTVFNLQPSREEQIEFEIGRYYSPQLNNKKIIIT